MGIQFSLPINKNLTFNPELKFAVKGYNDVSIMNSLFTPSENSRLALYYLSFGVPFKRFLTPVFFIEGGLHTGYLLKGILEFNYDNYTTEAITITQNLKKFDFGGIAGMGLQFKNGVEIAAIIYPGFLDIDANLSQYRSAPFGKNFLGVIEVSYLIKTSKN